MWFYGLESSEGRMARKRQMAENLTWFSEKVFPNKKIIVWTHNMHLAKGMQKYPSTWDLLPVSLKQQSYVTLFTAAEGRFTNSNWVSSTTIRNSASRSLEQRLQALETDYGLLLLSSLQGDRWPQDIRSAAIVNYMPNLHLNMANTADSVFYIKREIPATYIQYPVKPSLPQKLKPMGIQNQTLLKQHAKEKNANHDDWFWLGWANFYYCNVWYFL